MVLPPVLQKNYDLLLNLVIVGCAVSFVLCIFMATTVFDKVSPDSTLASEEIDMAVAFQATEAHIEVYMDAILLTHQIVDLKNIEKLDENFENPEAGSIIDLFPIGDPAYGRLTIEFKVRTVSKSEFPDISNKTSKPLEPMVYVRAETFNEYLKSVLKFTGFMIKTSGFFTWMMCLFSAGCIIAGVILIQLDNKKTVVEEVDDDD